MEEEWRKTDSIGFPGYEISSFGRLKLKDGSMSECKPNPYTGYTCLSLTSSDKIHKTVKRYILVAKMFIPNPENKPSVDHIDMNRSNDRADNLRWATYSEQLENQREKTADGKRRPVLQYDGDFNFIKRYESIKEVFGKKKPDYTSFKTAIEDKRLYKGFYWRFEELEIEGEEWKTLTEGCHSIEVSNMGRVRCQNGRITYGNENAGYLLFNFANKSISVHRLVMITFNPIDNYQKFYVNHKDRNRKNNTLVNLEWVTQKENMEHASGRPVLQFSREGEFIARFQSCVRAEEELIINKGAVSSCARGSLKTISGFRFCFEDELDQFLERIDDIPPFREKEVVRFDLNNKELERYDSVSLASKKLGVTEVSIATACRGVTRFCRGYKFCYADEIDEFFKRDEIAKVSEDMSVCLFSLEGKYLETFSSIKEASVKTGIPKHMIIKICMKKANYSKNTRWCLEDEKDMFANNLSPVKVKRIESVVQIKDGKKIAVFTSALQASKATKMDRALITRSCRNGTSLWDYEWKYLSDWKKMCEDEQ